MMDFLRKSKLTGAKCGGRGEMGWEDLRGLVISEGGPQVLAYKNELPNLASEMAVAILKLLVRTEMGDFS